MDHNPTGGSYSLRMNILTTAHAPGLIHRSVSCQKNSLLGPQAGPIPQPHFGRGNARQAGNVESINPFLADASMGRLDDPAPSGSECLTGSENVTPYLGDLSIDDLNTMCRPGSLMPDSASPECPAPPHAPFTSSSNHPTSFQTTPPQPPGLKTPERHNPPPSIVVPAKNDAARDHNPADHNPVGGSSSLSPSLSIGWIPKDRRCRRCSVSCKFNSGTH